MTLLALAGALDRWLLFAAVLVSAGAAAFRVLVSGRAGEGTRGSLAAQVARLGMVAAALALVAALGRLPLQLIELRDPGSPLGPQAGALITATMWGKAWIGQLVFAALATAAFGLARRGSHAWWAIAVIASLGLAATPAFSGHAIGSERWPSLAVIADALHVSGAGMWLGAMVVLFAGIAKTDAPDAQRLVAAFSPLALGAAALALATGVFASWLHLGSLHFLWQSRYGTTLLVKLGAVALMAGAGALNWRRAGPALRKTGQIGPMRRSIGAELAVGALVLLATAILVVTPPPGEE
jgi:copper transport protein